MGLKIELDFNQFCVEFLGHFSTLLLPSHFSFRRPEISNYNLLFEEESNDIQLTDSNRQQRIRQEQTLEAEILENDTLASIALRFNCTVADIKRLNKIEKDNEIFAFKVLKVPLTAHNILLDTLPKDEGSKRNEPEAPPTVDNVQLDKIEEKLLLESVSNVTISKSPDARDSSETIVDESNEPLLDRNLFRGYPRSIPAPKDFLKFNGSDCELNWIFLLIAILALCVIVPLIYVFLIYEHPEKYHATHSRYDDPGLHIIHQQHVHSTASNH